MSKRKIEDEILDEIFPPVFIKRKICRKAFNFPPSPPPKEPKKFEGKIETISDLIELAKSDDIYTNIDIDKVKKIVGPLKELEELIGMDNIKSKLLEQIMYYVQDLHLNSQDYLHTVITGPTGCGKTTIAKIMGRLFSNLGILSNQSFTQARADMLIAGYVGQTAIKTQELLKSAKGGVLFIDEVYSMGDPEKKGSFAKEAIDTINLFLSEQKHDFMLIVAGYEKEVDDCFFSYNQGLRRRFMWNYNIESYDSKSLAKIFKLKIKNSGWNLDEGVKDEVLYDFFKINSEKFSYNGGDVENFFTLCKICHSKRAIALELGDRKKLNIQDLEYSIKEFKKGKKGEDDHPPYGMYI